MLSPQEFVNLWGTDDVPLNRFHGQAIERLSIPREDKAFLTEAGLPAGAAPFLSFKSPNAGALPTVAEQLELPIAFGVYRVIGSDGSGNPIALDESNNGAVVLLDHENKFAKVLMNNSIRQLAESLLAYRELVRDSQKEFGVDAFLDGKLPPAARKALRQELTRIDPNAIGISNFWHDELQNLDAIAS